MGPARAGANGRVLQKLLTVAVVSAALVAADAGVLAQNGVGAGRTRFNVSVGWPNVSGQPDGNFTVAERNGVMVGLRAVQRYGSFDLPLQRYVQRGVYTVETGYLFGTATLGSWWGYSVLVDLRDGYGVAAGKTVQDYDILLDQNYWAGDLTFPGPVVIPGDQIFNLRAKCVTNQPAFTGDTIDPSCGQTRTVYQDSWAPSFGTSFDPTQQGAYMIRLSLVPRTFNGAPLSVTIGVLAVHTLW
jgi:hypothetical protein